MTTPNSAIVIVPSSSLSKSMNASLNSGITELLPVISSIVAVALERRMPRF